MPFLLNGMGHIPIAGPEGNLEKMLAVTLQDIKHTLEFSLWHCHISNWKLIWLEHKRVFFLEVFKKRKKSVRADDSEALGFDLSSVRDTTARRLVSRPPGCRQVPAGVCWEAGHQKPGLIGTVPAQYK